ncbi:CHAT domain-containing protein [Lactarius pseudohatsudake]|nr:CHAT domain-containing protein [Lactarius pseudohatsudake]
MLSEHPKSLDDSPSVPLSSHISIGSADEEESVRYDTPDLPEVVSVRLKMVEEMVEPVEPSRIAQLVALLYIPVPECLSTADVLGSIHDVDARITLHQRRLSISSSRADLSRPIIVLGMAMTRLEQHMLSNQIEDLEQAIVHLTELLLLRPHSWLEHGPNILEALFFLAFALLKRSELSKQPKDAIYAAKYLRYLRDQPHQAFGISRDEVTTFLVRALVVQVMFEVGNVMQSIGEMAVLCRELLALNMSTTHTVALFATVVLSKFRPEDPDQPLDQVIECLRAAKHELREARFALAQSLFCRYCMTFLNEDYEEAASVFDGIILSSSRRKSQDNFVATARQMVARLAMIRSMTHDTPEYSEEAIYRARSFLNSLPQEHPYYSVVSHSLEATAKQRFYYFGTSESFETLSEPMQVVTFGEGEDDDSEVGRIIKNVKLLWGLLSRILNIGLNNDITKIDEAIGEGRTVLASSAPRGLLTSYFFALFGLILFEAFQRTNRIRYLNESINTRRQVLEHPLPQFLRSSTLLQISLSLLTRSQSFPGLRAQDLDECLELLSHYVHDRHASLPDRSKVACLWASLARDFLHPTVSAAYESALSLMESSLLFAPTLQLQHAILAASNRSHCMPLDYASYQIDLHQLEQAVETLERGRALLWSEMRHLRAPIDQLLEADPQLAHKFAAISRDLEALTKSIPPSHELRMDDGAADDVRAVDPFSRLLLKQRTLLKEREDLISQIQDLPGFDSFLKSPSFDTLRSAASSGPVIIINHSRRRSDILILLHNSSPSLIPTPHNFYHRASALKDKLLDSQHKYGLGSDHYDEALASVLVELYNLVGKPVTDRLRELQVPEQSRIWWCPTSVFCSLPLHAMGPILSDDGKTHYFMDLYICSYTPTLSALIQSRNRGSSPRSSNRPSILLVAQPDPSLPTLGGEIQVVRALDAEVTGLISEAATPAAVIDGFHHHQFVHFACSGTLEAGKPFEAGFELYGERLTLLDVVRLDLPAAEFAFLSACNTAQITEGSVADEVLHLAAAVQFCGFKSVVAAMWAMVDEDGRDLAKHFYEALFSTSRLEEGIPYHEWSAQALQFAVKKLRRKRRITLERWVNFVHYGA